MPFITKRLLLTQVKSFIFLACVCVNLLPFLKLIFWDKKKKNSQFAKKKMALGNKIHFQFVTYKINTKKHKLISPSGRQYYVIEAATNS